MLTATDLRGAVPNPFMKRALVPVFALLVACGGPEALEESSTVDSVTCSPRMSVFPVGEAHNIGYDRASCGTGTCQVSCPDRNANSDWSAARGHHGIDIFARRRAPLVAVAPGTIVRVGVVSATSGLRVRLRDDCGWEYYYGHLDQAVVSPGQRVQAGQLIGYMGNTGTSGVHLHFNVSPDGNYSNDINPFQLLEQTSPTACAASPTPTPPPQAAPQPQSGCSVFHSHTYLAPGRSIQACDGAPFQLTHQQDGNVVLRRTDTGQALWSTGTRGRSTGNLNMQADGNLVLYSPTGTAIWNSGTHGNPGAFAFVHGDGNFRIHRPNLQPIWSTNTTVSTPPPPPPAGCGKLDPNVSLGHNEAVRSCNDRYQLVHQGDGNVVLYDTSRNRALWYTGTHGRSTSTLSMQGDGNLVLYSSGGSALFHTGTHGNPGAFLAVQDDGNLVIYVGSRVLWSRF